MKALLLVDIQNDFTPTGALPVPEGDQVVPVVNSLQSKFDLIVATQDWHPQDHQSFAVYHGKNPGEIIMLNGIEQILWPVHCVQESSGARFIPELNMNRVQKIIQKGLDPQVDSYSGFFDNDHKSATGLGDFLKEKGVEETYVTGLALDYCVKFTALDSNAMGFKTRVVVDATRAVNINPGDGDKAVDDMKKAGIEIVESKDL